MQAFLRYFGAVMFVCGVGVLAWYLSGTSNEDGSRDKKKDVIEWRSQVIGWMSAVLYRECSARLYAFLFLIPKPIFFSHFANVDIPVLSNFESPLSRLPTQRRYLHGTGTALWN